MLENRFVTIQIVFRHAADSLLTMSYRWSGDAAPHAGWNPGGGGAIVVEYCSLEPCELTLLFFHSMFSSSANLLAAFFFDICGGGCCKSWITDNSVPPTFLSGSCKRRWRRHRQPCLSMLLKVRSAERNELRLRTFGERRVSEPHAFYMVVRAITESFWPPCMDM